MPAAQPAAEPTRARVLQAALDLIADKGFAATTTREVCERMGFTKAALYYWFKSKDELLAALVQPVIDDLELLVGGPAGPDPAPRRDLVVRYAELVARHAEVMRALSDDPSVRRHPLVIVAQDLHRQLARLLAGTDAPDVAARARVRSAVGGLHAALLRGDAGDDPAVLRRAGITAACGALELPIPRSA